MRFVKNWMQTVLAHHSTLTATTLGPFYWKEFSVLKMKQIALRCQYNKPFTSLADAKWYWFWVTC